MDKDTRNLIRQATQDARDLLEREFAEQLEGTYDILRSGKIASDPGAHLDARERLVREKLVAAVQHHQAQGMAASEAVHAYLREASFTFLNRFVALKMLEARQLVQECVSRGELSAGFREFAGLAAGLNALPDRGYRLYVESLFDEIGREVRVLFDRSDPASLLWPRRAALHTLLEILNREALTDVWAEDETIGWVYQYFNRDEERRAMREASQAPRNSRELAVRNQFFTPRYVVQFLTDNTLGRIWYEMRQGKTRLAEQCEYLVRRPKEVFLAEGEAIPEAEPTEDLSQEELLRRPAYVPFRAKKDPRDLKVLDPACGSGHFLLYCFDLLLTIYEEAWADEETPASGGPKRSLREDYGHLDELRHAVPGLILQHNLHGIDIDARCAQIAALGLWMRAQRAFNDFGISRAERPTIRKTNIVVAEPMPGDRKLLEEFLDGVDTRLRPLVREVVRQMELAGEAGSLLKIEEALKEAIEQARFASFTQKPVQMTLLEDGKAPVQEVMEFASAEEFEFWDQAEREVLRALEAYAGRAAGAAGIRRRLFAHDAVEGFAFIDLCRRRYDVVLMNPPFGDATNHSLAGIDEQLARSGRDIGAAFVLAAVQRWCPRGKAGVLLSTATWFQPVFQRWRELTFVADSFTTETAAHLGGEVLDGATVSASPFVIGFGNPRPAYVFRLRRERHGQAPLQSLIANVRRGRSDTRVFVVNPSEVCVFPGKPFCYWLSDRLRRTLKSLPPFEGTGGTVKQGTVTADDFRFIRAWWEVPSDSHIWQPFTKTSEFSPYWDDITWVAKVGDRLAEIDATGRGRIQAVSFFGRSGVTYPIRSVLGFNPRLQPTGCAFGNTGPVAFGNGIDSTALLTVLASRPVEYIVSLFVGDLQGQKGVHPNHYEVGTIQRIPWPEFSANDLELFSSVGEAAVGLLQALNAGDEVTRSFHSPVSQLGGTLEENFQIAAAQEHRVIDRLVALRQEAELRILRAYDFTEADASELSQAFGERVAPATGRWRQYFGLEREVPSIDEYAKRYVSWLVGLVFGRWQPRELSYTSEHSQPMKVDARPGLITPAMLSPNDAGPPETRSTDRGLVMVDDRGHPNDLSAALMREIARLDSRSQGGIEAGTDWLGQVIGFTSLDAWMRLGAKGFLDHHIKLYSKARRKAPIYWQLSLPSARYSVWLYYHGLTPDTLYTAAELAKQKLQHEEGRLTQLRQEAPNPTRSQAREIEEQERFVEELRAFHAELARVAPLWKPDLNDGVIINFAPLWRLVPQHAQWQRECRDCWEKLVAGDYDWSHLAMHLWPERVVPKCGADRSLAIAHGLEETFWFQDEDRKWQPRKTPLRAVSDLVAERTSAAVRAALQDLLSAPEPAGRARGRRR